MKKLAVISAVLILSGCAGVTFVKTNSGMDAKFTFKNAKEISMYTSTDGYAEHKAEGKKDSWLVHLPYADSMTYFITADGVQTLPDCEMKEFDDFGGQLCVREEEEK